MRLSFLALLLLPAIAASQDRTAVVEFDHPTGEARLITSGAGVPDTSHLGVAPVVRLDRRTPVEIRVVNTNTALYRFSKQATVTQLPETESIQSFMGRLQPYMPELRSALSSIRGRGEADPAANPEEQARALRNSVLLISESMSGTTRSLRGVDAALFGPTGLQGNLAAALLALEQMRAGVAPEEASAPLRRALGLGAPCTAERPVRLDNARNLLTSLSEVVAHSADLRQALSGPSFAFDAGWMALRDSALAIEQRAQGALSDFEPLVSTAYRVERLVGIVASACSRWSAGVATGTMTSGQQVVIKVEPRTEVETARLATIPPKSFTVAVQPRALVRPAVALGGIAVPGGRFPNYDTRPASGGVEIYESGRRDARFSLGGSLGLTWRGFDRREDRGIALWLPELVIAGGGATGFGVGSAVSWNFVKLGVGAMWVKHTALDGQAIGQVIADPSRMELTDRYGPPRLYISLGVFDWAPFAGRIPVD